MCGMEANSKKKGKYETCTSYTEVEVSRRDTYVTFAQKSAFAVGFLDGEDDLALFKPKGGVKVSNKCITLQNGVKVPWSIGAYLQRARKSSDKVIFGVAYEVQASITYYIMTGYSIIRECGSTLYIGIAMVFHYHII